MKIKFLDFSKSIGMSLNDLPDSSPRSGSRNFRSFLIKYWADSSVPILSICKQTIQFWKLWRQYFFEETGELKAVFLRRGWTTKFLWGFCRERNKPDKNKLGFLKIANSGDFETVNFVQIGQFLMVL